MRKLKIAVIDLVSKGPTKALYARVMNPNLTSIMPQVVSAWCEEAGHDVQFLCYTGFENLLDELPENTDIVFITSFTQAALLSYALSAMFRKRGAVTVLGGPHARCYPQDAAKYFDFVTGFTDKQVLYDILTDAEPHRPIGRYLAATQQPDDLPSMEERWKFIEPTLAKAPTIKIVPMIGSLGCPYTCSFCIDSVVDYKPLSFDRLREDLRFLRTKLKRPRVGWHDPNFGVRFNDIMDAIEDAVPPGSMDHIAESSLSLLAENRLERLKKNGFKAILPGIESWYELGNKSKSGKRQGKDKVQQVSEHINLIVEYIPYLQANFVLGLDCDEGKEPFELTKEFVDKTPAAFPGYSLLSAFGQAAPLNLELQEAGRVLPFPFHFLNNHHAMNVRPKNYSWPEFYDNVIDLTKYSFSWKNIARRFRAQGSTIPGWMNLLRAVSSEGFGRIKYYTKIRELLDTDTSVRRFFEGETTEIPQFYVDRIKTDLGDLWHFLPEGALYHDQNAYLKDHKARQDVVTLQKA
ncbi:MAG: radical SAM protein [Gemmatimonadetes bacterium]|nr:radical SAM protein [Gemmatimonadota bacterium]